MDKHTSKDEGIGLKKMKEHQQNRKLVSSELGDLFANYLGDSLYACVFEHHLQVVEDDEVKDFIQLALDKSKKHIRIIAEIYKKEGIPVPEGFGEQDIRKDAPRLFGDLFMVFYITEMARAGLVTYGSAFSTSYRQDIVDYFKSRINETIEIYIKGSELLLSKGVDISSPTIPYPKKVDFVDKDSFVSLIAGKSRPLTALEIKHLQININTNTLGKAMMLAFSQVASSEKVKKYFKEGVKVATNQMEQLSTYLMKDNLPVPQAVDEHVTDSTIAPFSDKLMLYHTSLANAIGIQNYGMAISKMMRHDIHAQMALLSAQIAKYANEGLYITINRGWLEEPPTAADREELAK
ncbi:DUF3231 family protein [Aquibacillus sp. 3ASR75-11]|uniref:DUF3231 family protein n=1 Tax=Terrihalobacillus insolitus TaxID=2950438 RepID=A0A9X3WSG8_9BACI|nr:DUF3231 family protein [Terrihalobacillus insolitus]MDC3413638.1 DUF3231 family protein [Terrihalobacillus insolitus]MDC3424605.1 DUF3231 family protein [Terrihalobacillus insolitus]